MGSREKIKAVLRLSLVALVVNRTAAPAQAAGLPTVSLITATHAETIYKTLLEKHWVASTGLFESFPDSSDAKLAQQASLYEQGAAGLLALRMGDMDRAQDLLHFLKEQWQSAAQKPERHGVRGLSNFYNAEFGSEGIETTIHVGPNAWAALFAARMANQTHDQEALNWALDMAYWITHQVPHQNGGVAMGPVDNPQGAPWAHIFSTENNLSYDAFLCELLRSTALSSDQRAALAQEQKGIEHWLLTAAINPATGRTIRGLFPNGTDTIQALDTYTWMMSAVGPHRLAEHGIDPDRFMAQAASAFEVTVNHLQGVDPSDQAEADFTFAHDHARPREAMRPATQGHRMVWFEGLGQYILALGAMADYSRENGRTELADRYLAKAQQMTSQFDQAAKANRYPYATVGRFFRDGWRTPAPSAAGPASSLIASVWRCFAGLGVDPVSGRNVSSIQSVHVAVPSSLHMIPRKPSIMYGTSEQMVMQSWNALNDNDADRAIRQAQATINEWSLWAKDQEGRKKAEVGDIVNFTGEATEKNKIFKYWALNDVGAACFVLGKAYDQKHDYANAAKAFAMIADDYSLAQVWDPQGWFWTPLEAVRTDFVERDPSHYKKINV